MEHDKSLYLKRGLDYLEKNKELIDVYVVKGDRENIKDVDVSSVTFGFPSADSEIINYFTLKVEDKQGFIDKVRDLLPMFSESFLCDDGQDKYLWKAAYSEAQSEDYPLFALIFGKVENEEIIYVYVSKGITLRKAFKNFTRYAGRFLLGFDFNFKDDF